MAPLTGRKVLAITVAAFAIIIGVNLFMAVKAVGTFPGLEVKNSYVASQTFDADRAAQEALGWHVQHGYEGGVITFALRDQADKPVAVKSFAATIGRPTHVREDVSPAFTYQDGLFTAPVDLAPGNWLIHLEAIAPDGTPFRQRFDFIVKG